MGHEGWQGTDNCGLASDQEAVMTVKWVDEAGAPR